MEKETVEGYITPGINGTSYALEYRCITTYNDDGTMSSYEEHSFCWHTGKEEFSCWTKIEHSPDGNEIHRDMQLIDGEEKCIAEHVFDADDNLISKDILLDFSYDDGKICKDLLEGGDATHTEYKYDSEGRLIEEIFIAATNHYNDIHQYMKYYTSESGIEIRETKIYGVEDGKLWSSFVRETLREGNIETCQFKRINNDGVLIEEGRKITEYVTNKDGKEYPSLIEDWDKNGIMTNKKEFEYNSDFVCVTETDTDYKLDCKRIIKTRVEKIIEP